MKPISLCFLIVLINLVFTNCDSTAALDLLGPEIEVDLAGNIVYQATDPENSVVCMEIKLPIDYKPEDVRKVLVEHLDKKVPVRTQQFINDYLNFSLPDLEVEYGACPTEGLDEFVCDDKNFGASIPIKHSYKVLTYDGTATGTQLLFVENFCNQL